VSASAGPRLGPVGGAAPSSGDRSQRRHRPQAYAQGHPTLVGAYSWSLRRGPRQYLGASGHEICSPAWTHRNLASSMTMPTPCLVVHYCALLRLFRPLRRAVTGNPLSGCSGSKTRAFSLWALIPSLIPLFRSFPPCVRNRGSPYGCRNIYIYTNLLFLFLLLLLLLLPAL